MADADSILTPRTGHLDVMLNAYFNDGGGIDGDLSIEEKRIKVLAMVNRQIAKRAVHRPPLSSAVPVGTSLDDERKEESPEVMNKQDVVEMMEVVPSDNGKVGGIDAEGDLSRSNKLEL